MRVRSWLTGALLALALWPRPGLATPFLPTDDGEVLERMPVSPLDPNARRLQGLRREVAAQPENLALATKLAWQYIEAGRSLSDPRYYGYAQGALSPWWKAAEPPVPVLVLRATIRQHDHDFPRALDDLSLALRADPSNAQAWLTQATVLQVRGEYAEARRSCMEVLQLATPLVAVTCVSAVGSLNGEAARSYDMLSHALAQAPQAEAGVRRWALTTLAEIAARRGQPEVAEAHFAQALALSRNDEYLLGAYADFLLDQQRPGEARDLLRNATNADALLLRLALAEQMDGAPEREAHVAALRDRFAAARRRGDSVHRREEARFALRLLGEPRQALQLARDNWEVQREPWDARLLLEAAIAAGDGAAARPVLEFRARSGIEDVTLARLAGEIEMERP